jgi:hypothetical protein
LTANFRQIKKPPRDFCNNKLVQQTNKMQNWLEVGAGRVFGCGVTNDVPTRLVISSIEWSGILGQAMQLIRHKTFVLNGPRLIEKPGGMYANRNNKHTQKRIAAKKEQG